MKFSVVIPVYNGAATIERAVESVLAQSKPAFEIVVVDDASTDSTVSRIGGRFGGQVNLIRLKENGGSSVARNAGMEAATGDYIAFLDADDTWHRDKLRIVEEALASNPGIGLLFHRSTAADFETLPLPVYSGVSKISFLSLLPRNIIQTPCAVLRNDPAFRFEPSMRYMEDYDLWLRVTYRHGAYFLDLPLTRLFRPVTSPGGISARKWLMRKGELTAYTRLVKLSPVFVFLLPLLWLNSLVKHFLKAAPGKTKSS